jgi:alpha-1,6-mannosyltransferase
VAAIVISLVVGIFGPTANGDRFALFQIIDATLASTVIVVALIGLTYTRLPWRRPPGQDTESNGEPVNDTATTPPTPPTPRPAPAHDAYADST